MKKTIILPENYFNRIKNMIIKEAIAPNPYLFGLGAKAINYKSIVDSLNKNEMLKTSAYKDETLENTYRAWEEKGFDKSSYEYVAWGNALNDYMTYLARGIDFILGKAERIGLSASTYWVFIDPEWAKDVMNKKDAKDHQCIYSLVLKLCQNKSMWNDLFFNPIFQDMKDKFFKIRSFVGKAFGINMNYKLLMPLEQYREIVKYSSDQSNAKPELFYEPPQYEEEEEY